MLVIEFVKYFLGVNCGYDGVREIFLIVFGREEVVIFEVGK